MASPSDFKSKELVVVPGAGEYDPPTKLSVIVPSQVLVSYGASLSELSGTAWQAFPYPSGVSLDTHRASDFTVSTDTQVAFTYTGAATRWFRISAVCNAVKDPAALGTARKLSFVWRRNGVDVGYVRTTHMPAGQDCAIISATGQLPLAQGDVLVPFVCDEVDGGVYRLQMCSFDICEDTPFRL